LSRLRLYLSAVLLVGMLLQTAPPSLADDIPVGSNAVVYNTNGGGVRLREAPNTQASIVTTIPEGAQVVVVEGPLTDPAGQEWYKVSYNGLSGWVVGNYLGVPGTVPVLTPGRGLGAPSAPVSAAPAGLAASPAAGAGLAAPPAAPSLSTALAPAGAASVSATTATSVTTATTVLAPAPKPPPAPPRSAQGRATGAQLTQLALSLVGTPYVWAGKSPAGFDCAGLVVYVYGQFNVNLPPTTYDQWNFGRQIAQADLLIGDLVFFANTYGPGITHVGIYVGDNMFVHAENESSGVVRSSLVSGYWSTKFYGARRVID